MKFIIVDSYYNDGEKIGKMAISLGDVIKTIPLSDNPRISKVEFRDPQTSLPFVKTDEIIKAIEEYNNAVSKLP